MREQGSSYTKKKVTSPEPHGVKVETLKGLYGECQTRRVPGNGGSKRHFTWQIR